MSSRGAVTRWVTVVTALAVMAVTPAPGWAQDPLLGRRLKDAGITALVKTRLLAARPANAISIDVDTDEGVVRLRGSVPGPAEWEEAQRVAAETPGVRSVRNELRFEHPVGEPGSG